jgi:hypothetical protein
MRPPATASRLNPALVQFGGNRVAAGYAARLYLTDHRQDIGCKLIGGGLPGCRAKRRRLREPGIAESIGPPCVREWLCIEYLTYMPPARQITVQQPHEMIIVPTGAEVHHLVHDNVLKAFSRLLRQLCI